MKFNFIYTIENEIKEVSSLLEDAEFLVKNEYEVLLPKDISLSIPDGQEVRRAVEREFEDNRRSFEKKTSGLGTELEKIIPFFENYFNKRGFTVPEEINIIFSAYGTLGGYGLPNKITIRLDAGERNFSDIIIHEVAHLVLEEPVINKFNLTHFQKERLIDWLFTDTELRKITTNYIAQPTDATLPKAVTEVFKS